MPDLQVSFNKGHGVIGYFCNFQEYFNKMSICMMDGSHGSYSVLMAKRGICKVTGIRVSFSEGGKGGGTQVIKSNVSLYKFQFLFHC